MKREEKPDKAPDEVANDNGKLRTDSHGYQFFKRVPCKNDVPIIKDGATPGDVLQIVNAILDQKFSSAYQKYQGLKFVIENAAFAYVSAFAQSDITKTAACAAEKDEDEKVADFEKSPRDSVRRISYVTYQFEDKLTRFMRAYDIADDAQEGLNSRAVIGSVIRTCLDQYEKIMGVKFAVSRHYQSHAEQVKATLDSPSSSQLLQ